MRTGNYISKLIRTTDHNRSRKLGRAQGEKEPEQGRKIKSYVILDGI